MIKKIQYACLISAFTFLAFPSHGMEPKTSEEFPPFERSDSDLQTPGEVNQKTEHKTEIKRDQLGEQHQHQPQDEEVMQKKENGGDVLTP